MFRQSITLGKLFGIPIKIDVSWILIFAWVSLSLGSQYTRNISEETPTTLAWVAAVLTSLAFFASVLAHELAHSLIARKQGVPVRDITLFIFGGISQITDEPKTAKAEAVMAGVGPLTSLILAAVFYGIYRIFGLVSPLIRAPLLFLATANLSLGIFNLLPGFPLDGGRVLRAVLWGAKHDLRWATRVASYVGQGVAYLFILYGIFLAAGGDWLNGIWLVFIGLFLENAARSSYSQLNISSLLQGHTVREVMSLDCVLLPQQLTLDLAVDEYLVRNPRRCYLVNGPKGITGLLTAHRISQIPKDRWPTTHISEVVIPLSDVKSVTPETNLWQALQQMTSEGVNQLPVLAEGELVGMLTRDKLLTFIRDQSALLGGDRKGQW
ncbi:MAG: site-2 protease family protein [Chloroflexi bacterium]|nr:site-2 protease family protein [Chloroflexota bacterium]